MSVTTVQPVVELARHRLKNPSKPDEVNKNPPTLCSQSPVLVQPPESATTPKPPTVT